MAARPRIRPSSPRSEDLKARGIDVTLTPFILMDVPDGNTLPDPYGGGGAAGYPWRGRITCHPAPGRPGTPDKTATAAAQIAAFVGTAAPGALLVERRHVVYSGPAEWSLPAHGAASGVSGQGGGRRLGLRHRHGVARADDGAQFGAPIILSSRRSRRLPPT